MPGRTSQKKIWLIQLELIPAPFTTTIPPSAIPLLCDFRSHPPGKRIDKRAHADDESLIKLFLLSPLSPPCLYFFFFESLEHTFLHIFYYQIGRKNRAGERKQGRWGWWERARFWMRNFSAAHGNFLFRSIEARRG